MTRNQEIAKTILTQMGGNKIVVMVGAKDMLAIENGLSFRFMRSNGMNCVRIVLDEGADLYNMESCLSMAYNQTESIPRRRVLRPAE